MSREFNASDGCWHTRRDQIRYLLADHETKPGLAVLLTKEQ